MVSISGARYFALHNISFHIYIFLFRINKKYSEINLKCDNFSPGCQSESAVF